MVWVEKRQETGGAEGSFKRYQAPGLAADKRWTVAVRCVSLVATSMFSQRLPPALLSVLAGADAIQQPVHREVLLGITSQKMLAPVEGDAEEQQQGGNADSS